MHKCIECLCHARTGCYNRITCANYSINRSYWETAGSPSLPGDDPDDERSYTKCMQNENCILNTIVGYTSSFNNLVSKLKIPAFTVAYRHILYCLLILKYEIFVGD